MSTLPTIPRQPTNPTLSIFLPLSLIIGTGVVTVLYVLLNYTFLLTAPISELVGQPEVAYFPAKYIFGINGAQTISVLIALLLGYNLT
jgi:APA family basic amino acid/polyamine antiporter